MPVPLYQAKAEFFQLFGHPLRIRDLELLQDGPTPVRRPQAPCRGQLSQEYRP